MEGVRANFPFYTIFKGIPFMAPPVGENRWKEPQPVQPWEGVLRCDRFAPTCMQPPYASEGGLIANEFMGVQMPMDEDCMYLNIWTPAESEEEKLPVAVYFHGGAYTTGLSYLNCFDGEGFNKRGIIFVTIPYRLNIFGFLAHPLLTEESEHKASGNYAYLDLIAGLKWVRRNIRSFGGDPENVTIFGQSAGAGCVRAMCTSPLADGLFRRAIIQSIGVLDHKPFTVWGKDLSTAEQLGRDFWNYCGYTSVEEARQASAQELLDRFMAFGREKRYETDDEQYAGGYLRFGPVERDGYFYPEISADAIRRGHHKEITYVIGSTANEYPYMTPCNIAFAENEICLGRKPAYVYYFQYVPPGAEEEGAHHSVEHHYVFQTLFRSQRPYGGFDFELSNEMADRWAAFFKTGDPNCPEKPYAQWRPYSKEDREVLGITRKGCHMMFCPMSPEREKRIREELERAVNEVK